MRTTEHHTIDTNDCLRNKVSKWLRGEDAARHHQVVRKVAGRWLQMLTPEPSANNGQNIEKRLGHNQLQDGGPPAPRRLGIRLAFQLGTFF